MGNCLSSSKAPEGDTSAAHEAAPSTSNAAITKPSKAPKAKKEKHNARTQETLGRIQHIPMINMMNDSQKVQIAQALKEKNFMPGEVLMREGQVGNEFFLITSGICEVIVGNAKVSELRDTDYCGEQALLNANAKRTATVKAKEETKCLVMERDAFQKVVRQTNIKFNARRMHLALSEEEHEEDAPSGDEENEEEEIKPDVEQKDWLVSCVKTNMLFSDMETKDVADIVQSMRMAKSTEYEDNCIIAQGAEKGNEFFVIDEGDFVVEKDGEVVDNIARGSCIGELALVFNAPRNATIRALSEDATVWVLTRSRYRAIANKARKQGDDKIIEFLRAIPLFGSLYNSEIALMSKALEKVELTAGTTIFNQGDEGDKFYLIMRGCCMGYEMREDGSQKVFELSEGEYFGEIALRTNKPRTATIAAKSELVLLQVSRKDFSALFGSLDSLMERQIEEYQRPEQSNKEYRQSLFNRSLADLERGPMVGRGKYGAVQFVYDSNGKTTYALKMVAKSWVHARKVKQSKRRINALFNERNVMRAFSSDNCQFLVKLRGTFKDEKYVYFLMEAALGGDFFNILKTRGSVNEKTAQFFAACLIEAISHLHSHNMLHRDLKPENIVLDHRGYGMLTDFGFTKKLNASDKTYTLCGTPGYMAPEVILGQGYGKGSDWFSLGCVLYDMVTGAPPFPTRADQFTMIRQMMQNKLHLPMYLSFWIKDLICQMLKLKTVKRLGVIKGGPQRIRDHHWFQDFDWESLRNGTLASPVQPTIKNPMDVSNFDSTCLEQPMKTKSNIPLAPELENWDVNF